MERMRYVLFCVGNRMYLRYTSGRSLVFLKLPKTLDVTQSTAWNIREEAS